MADFRSIIALAGLGGHAFESFKERDGEHMWLRDDLPYDLTPLSNERPTARIMTYGYKSVVVNSTSFQTFEDIATQLIASLRSLAEGPTTRPIVFIAHNLGGIIVKQVGLIIVKIDNKGIANLSLGTNNPGQVQACRR